MIGWRLLCGGLVFVAVSTCAAAGLAALAGKLMPLTAWLALVLGAAAGFFLPAFFAGSAPPAGAVPASFSSCAFSQVS